MNDGISILLAFFVIVVVFRWLLASTSETQTLRRPHNTTLDQFRMRPRPVTAEMVETVCAMFPNIPPAAVQFDLQKTGSVEVTCDNILQNGGTLPMPPAAIPQQPFQLEEAVAKNAAPEEPPRTWEQTAEKRAEILRKRKEAMILKARMYEIGLSSSQRYLEQEKNDQNTKVQTVSPTSSSLPTELFSKNFDLSSEMRRQQSSHSIELKMGNTNRKN
ncbi:639_t:CDS:2 [Paraglomus brasilianum]|uniref:639_t:CDS:1 n=1 Tax=Paraglomus brasilianum TaxID=144538 RepID=A0A9N8YZX0_9GLOM|nr:639_t:CDS:2 [Paraglomus brasilianum]